MGVAAGLYGKKIESKKHSWIVGRLINKPDDKQSPSNSYGYEVVSTDGRLGYLKAIDADLICAANDAVVSILAVALHHDFEAKISDHCRGNNMDRVTIAIDHGSTFVENAGVREPVFWLVFEMAASDVRKQVQLDRDWNTAKKLRLLHHVAVGLSQLHTVQVSHNDLKPPNVLAFKDGHRIADLGSATREGSCAPCEYQAVVGDPRYAAPESLYGKDGEPGVPLFSQKIRRAGDFYLLGSLAHYLFFGRMLTPCVIERLHPNHTPPYHDGGWLGTYAEILPFWRAAFADQLTAIRETALRSADQIVAENAHSLVRIIAQLCEPEPLARASVDGRSEAFRNRSLHEFISIFNRMATMAEANAKR